MDWRKDALRVWIVATVVWVAAMLVILAPPTFDDCNLTPSSAGCIYPIGIADYLAPIVLPPLIVLLIGLGASWIMRFFHDGPRL